MKQIWTHIHNFANMPLVHLVAYFGCSTTIGGCISNLMTVYTKSKHTFIHQVEGLIPLWFIALFVWLCFTYTEIAWTKPALIIYIIGPFFSLSCSRMIVGSVTHSKFTMFRDLHLSMPFIFAMIILPANSIYGLGLDETYLVFALIAINLAAYFQYVVNAISQICEALDIYCLTIKHPKKE